MIGPFLIMVAAGVIFLVVIVAILEAHDAAAARSNEAGAIEGDTRHFHLRSIEDQFKSEDF